MFKLIHKNHQGVTLVELLIAVAILGMIIPLLGGLLSNFIELNNLTIDKWDVQTAARMACRDFEKNKDGFTQAYQLDLLYDPVIEKGVTLKNDGTIEWKDSATPYVMNQESISDTSDEHTSELFTYIFSAETWKEDGTYLGELLYKREFGSTNSVLLLNDYGLGETPVSVTFSMGTNVDLGGNKYTDSNVIVHFGAGKTDIDFSYDTSFALVNNTRNINYSEGVLICEEEWLDDTGVPQAYPAGWDNYDLYIASQANSTNGFPTANSEGNYATNCTIKSGENTIPVVISGAKSYNMTGLNAQGKTETVQAPAIAQQANLLRYKSPTAESSQSSPEDKTTNTNVATCLTGFAMAGSDMADKVLGSIRLFRDEVLRGTEFGDWFIHQYYYEWSPFLIEHTAFLKPVYQAILIPVSYVCEFIAKL